MIVGFPESDGNSGKAFNSLAVVDATGTIQGVHRKHHLYETDESWASEGPSFSVLEVGLPRSEESIRICPCIWRVGLLLFI